ncbi:MAG TPA: AMP-binding protein, partial [Ktedonobacteraceae bacterium]|nr:AMP-binding protein [Ktedonobacteraceae bacterium]
MTSDEKLMLGDQELHALYDLATSNYRRFGTYRMLVYEDQQQQEVRAYTNVEVAREAIQLAVGLQALGIQPGDRVIVMMLNSPEVIISYQAIARAGAVIIPIMPLLKAPEVRYIAENSGAKAVITSPVLLPLLRAALAGIPTMQHIISTGEVETGEQEGEKGAASYTLHRYCDVVARGVAYAGHYLEDLPGIAPSPDDLAVTIYTSGTTGNPKGVMLTHRNLIANALGGAGEELAPRSEETQLAILPLAHGYGLLVSNVAYLSGASIVMHPRFDTGAVLLAIERYRINGFAGVPAMFVALLYTPDAGKYDTSSLEYCVSGSAPLPVAVLEAFEQK